METARFLRDLNDEKAYAQGLELAYVDAFNGITDVSKCMWNDCCHPDHDGSTAQVDARHKDINHVLFLMSGVIQDCVDRRKRLAHVAAGLPDVIFDEESAEKELSADPDRRD